MRMTIRRRSDGTFALWRGDQPEGWYSERVGWTEDRAAATVYARLADAQRAVAGLRKLAGAWYRR